MTLSLTWNSTALALPAADDGIKLTYVRIGGSARAADGTLRQQFVTRKAKIEIHWHGLTAGEYSTLYTTYGSRHNTASTLVLPDSRSYSVLCTSDFREGPYLYSRSGTVYYEVFLTFEEV